MKTKPTHYVNKYIIRLQTIMRLINKIVSLRVGILI